MWRQVADKPDHVFFDDNEGRHVLRIEGGKDPTAIQFDLDGISVHWRDHLRLHRMGYADVAAHMPQRPIVFEARVGDLRALQPVAGKPTHVVYTPFADGPIGCGHASILASIGDKEEKKLVRKALRDLLVLSPDSRRPSTASPDVSSRGGH